MREPLPTSSVSRGRRVYRLANNRIVPSFKITGTVAARRSSLTQWLEGLEERPTGD